MRFTLLCGLIVLAACVRPEQLQRESARVIQPTPYPDSVAITEVHISKVTGAGRWVATTRNGVYDCLLESRDSDGKQRPAICARRDTPR